MTLHKTALLLIALFAFYSLNAIGQTLEDDIGAAFDALEAVKYETEGDDRLDSDERDQLRENIKKEVVSRSNSRRRRTQGDHFNEAVEDEFYSDDIYEHFEECPTCNPIINRLLRRTGIERISLARVSQRPSIAVQCTTNVGACPMLVQIPSGSPCYCVTPYGTVWGVGQ